jgi:ATP-dependent Clp protease ATP-binding subunit ClpA
MKVSAEVEIACSLAAREAQRRGHDLFTVEHLLYALLHDDETAKVLRKSGGDVPKIKRAIEKVLDQFIARVPEGMEVTPTASRGFERVLSRAAIHVESSGHQELKGPNVLVAIFSELDSHAVKVLNEAGVTR